MADISHELEQIRSARYGDDMREAIADALETINREQMQSAKDGDDLRASVSIAMEAVDKAAGYSKELAALKEDLSNLSDRIKDNGDLSATQKEINILKNYVETITRSLSSDNPGTLKLLTKSSGLTRSAGDDILRDIPYSGDYATVGDLAQLRGSVNEDLSLKTAQYDFDYIVGNGFQDWTITDYIIRIREDYNTALAEMATRSEAQAIANNGVERLHNVIAVNQQSSEDTKLSFTPSLEEVELATMQDVNSTFGRIDGYFTFNWDGDWEIGGIDEHGWNADDPTMFRTADLLVSRDFDATLNSLYSLQIVQYDANRMMMRKREWITGSDDIHYLDEISPEVRYVRFLIKKNDGSELIDPMLPKQLFTITMHGTDWTGKNDNTAVDISVVNEVKRDLSSVDNRTGRLEGRANTAEANIAAIDGDIELIKDDISGLKALNSRKFDRVEYGDDNIAYFYSGEELIDTLGPIVSGTGSGGGGGGGEGGGGSSGNQNNAIFTARNASGGNMFTIPEGDVCPLSVEWSSLEDGSPTGSGVLTVFVNGVQRILKSVEQGTVTFDPSKYLQSGRNLISINVTDIYNNKWYGSITVYSAIYSVKLLLDSNTVYEGAFDLAFNPSGDGEKTVHFKLDGTELTPFTTSLSNRVFTKAIPAQSHGAHSIEVWITAEVNGNDLESVHERREFISIQQGVTTPIIISNFNETTVGQYTNISIVHKVYDPLNANARVVRYANNVAINTVTIDRTEQTWDYRALDVGFLTLALECRGVRKTFNLSVTKSDADIGSVTDSLQLYLGAGGRDNGEDNPAVWTYEGISATMTDFNFVSDGWVKDEDGNTVCRHSSDARTVIPYRIFERDAKTTGLTVEIEFETRYVRNYDTPIISCYSGNRGLLVTSQRATLKSEQSEISVQFKEEEHVRISFTVERRNEHRLVLCYINGICSGAIVYPDADDFSQIAPVGITIGSNDAVVDVYNIRVYNNTLNRLQILGNMIADTQNVDDMLDMYDRNNIFDGEGNIVISKLPRNLPYMIVNTEGTHLPNYKGDKVTVSGSYTDQQNTSKSFTFFNAQYDVQGTSSQYYARKNFKAKYKDGFIMNGETVKKYAMTADSIPVNTFCFKKDVASSEGANNVELVALYDRICPYKTPAQMANPLVRQGIEGYPMVIFENDGEKVRFVGKYNFNNDKSTEDVFGFVEGDESWEVKNNGGNRVIFKSDDFTGTDWLNDYEARYPDTDPPYTDPTQLAELSTFLKSTDTTAATGASITPVTYAGVTYNTDSAEYRLAKFKNEVGNYIEINSMLFYYLFTDIFLMVDSRAKNMFPSFMGAAIA